ncbi:MAG: methionine--tRNA ligase subunit beta, partial [Lachnospiraceae bacterium]|nr:methionine--tRNA ligase subunit beta [Lachnospiraceae bacterium]
VYVWLDALVNYITGIGYDADGNHGELYRSHWPADLHLIGKDIVRFHTIYWPIFLMALEEPLPKQVFGHPWLLVGDGKMSKSKGNTIYADTLVDMFGIDAVRYFMIHEMPFDNDGVFTWDTMVERYNSDLANTLGNLVKRTISMSNQYLGGVTKDCGVKEDVDDDLYATALSARERAEEKMSTFHVADAITEIFEVFKRSNKYIDETTPWILAKDEEKKERLSTVLYNLCDCIVIGASLLSPYMPDTAKAILDQMNTAMPEYDALDKRGAFVSGTKVSEDPATLFDRKKLEDVLKEVEKLYPPKKEESDKKDGGTKSAAKEAPAAEHKSEITIDDFDKMELRVGVIKQCEAVEKSKKLLCSQVDIGDRTLQIVSGIRKHYSPEEMVGKRVMVITNLAPAKLAGVESQGMLLCAEDAEGNLALMTPEKDMPAGAEIC